jgi:hypothetical protein
MMISISWKGIKLPSNNRGLGVLRSTINIQNAPKPFKDLSKSL